MPPYGFRIRALVPRNRLPATEDDTAIVLPLGDPVVTIAIQGGTAGRVYHLILRSAGFATESAALMAGLEAKAALRATGVSMNVPMDLGPDTASTGIGQVVKDSVRDQFNVELRGDVHGLDIFDEGGAEMRHLRIGAEGSVIANREQFVANLARFIEGAQKRQIDDRVQLAADVYMGAAFESSDRARFVADITVLEILADRRPRIATAVSLIDDWMTEVGENEDRVETEAASLAGALPPLRAKFSPRKRGGAMLIRVSRVLMALAFLIGSTVAVLAIPQAPAEASDHWTGWITMTNDLSSDPMVGEREVTYTITPGAFPAAEGVYTERQEILSKCNDYAGWLYVAEGTGTGTIYLEYSENNPGVFEWYVRVASDWTGTTDWTRTGYDCPDFSGVPTTSGTSQCCMDVEIPFTVRPIPTGVTDPNPQSIVGTYVDPNFPTYVYSFAFGDIAGNRPPVAVPDTLVDHTPPWAPVPFTIDVLANDYDPDGDPISVTTALAEHGTVSINDGGQLVFQSGTGSCIIWIDLIHYQITDGRGGFAWGTVLVQMRPWVDKPCGLIPRGKGPR